MYQSYLVEPEDTQKSLDEITEQGQEFLSMAYLSDSRQVLIVAGEAKRSSPRSIEDEDIEQEQE